MQHRRDPDFIPWPDSSRDPHGLMDPNWPNNIEVNWPSKEEVAACEAEPASSKNNVTNNKEESSSQEPDSTNK